MILADEAKSIRDEMLASLARCTATWRVYASSALPASADSDALQLVMQSFRFELKNFPAGNLISPTGFSIALQARVKPQNGFQSYSACVSNPD
jgi:hypothetical protein